MTFVSPTDLVVVRTRLVTAAADAREADSLGLRLVGSADGWLVFPGRRVPDGVADRVRDLAAAAAPHSSESQPELVAQCARVLEREAGPPRIESELIFRIGDCLHAEPVPEIDVLASPRGGSRVASLERPLSWEQDEWAGLLGGRLGPWAIAAVDEAVVSVCHTPGLVTADAVECGVWTRPDFRGRRLAHVTTAAWAGLVRAPGRSLLLQH